MKLVMLTYLEGDEKCVERMLAELGVHTFSRLPIEGHGPSGSGGWYGSETPFRSGMILVVTEDEIARSVLAGVKACTGVEDPRHPIRAFLLGVENAAACGCDRPEPAGRGD
jgi:hypothetical protein